jgi:hypothetical protein
VNVNLSLNRNSWWLKVAEYGGLSCEDRTDICSLTRRFLWGLIRAPFWGLLAGAVIAAVLAIVVGWPLIGVVAYLLEGVSFDWESLIPSAAVLVGLSLGFAVCQAAEAGGIKKVLRNATPQMVRAAYRGWKEKTCVLIEVSD